jgi:hypothetical protein
MQSYCRITPALNGRKIEKELTNMTKTKKTNKTVASKKAAKKTVTKAAKKAAKTTPVASGERTSRKAEVISALKKGASIDALMNMPGRTPWQRHSVRGFICTLAKTMPISSALVDGVRTYKLA